MEKRAVCMTCGRNGGLEGKLGRVMQKAYYDESYPPRLFIRLDLAGRTLNNKNSPVHPFGC